MPWINGRWRPEGWQTSGFHRGPVGGGFPGLLDPGSGGPIGDKPGVSNYPPQINPPGYSKGPQMQPTPYKPVQWAGPDAIYPNWGDPAGPYANDVAMIPMGEPPSYQPHTPWQSGLAPRQPWTPPPQRPIQGPPIPPRMVAPQPIYGSGPQMRPTLPTIDPGQPPIINPGGGWDPDPGIIPPPLGARDPTPPPLTDHEYNVQQREKTKARLAVARGKTKAHLANLREKGVSAKTIAKAKAKAQGRYTKIKGQSLRRGTTNGEAEK